MPYANRPPSRQILNNNRIRIKETQALSSLVNFPTDIKLNGEREIKRTDDNDKDGDNWTVHMPSTGIEEPSAKVIEGNEEDGSRLEKMVDIPVR